MKNKQYYRFLRSSAPKPLQNCAVKFIVKNKRLDLKCFIQPDGCKQCWENCAAILINVGYPRNECVIDGMFEWLQDLNWPGAQQIKSYLPNLP